MTDEKLLLHIQIEMTSSMLSTLCFEKNWTKEFCVALNAAGEKVWSHAPDAVKWTLVGAAELSFHKVVGSYKSRRAAFQSLYARLVRHADQKLGQKLGNLSGFNSHPSTTWWRVIEVVEAVRSELDAEYKASDCMRFNHQTVAVN